jgi:hypothetical protein
MSLSLSNGINIFADFSYFQIKIIFCSKHFQLWRKRFNWLLHICKKVTKNCKIGPYISPSLRRKVCRYCSTWVNVMITVFGDFKHGNFLEKNQCYDHFFCMNCRILSQNWQFSTTFSAKIYPNSKHWPLETLATKGPHQNALHGIGLGVPLIRWRNYAMHNTPWVKCRVGVA